MSYGADLLGITEDTFQMVKAATAGITGSSQIYNLTIDQLVSLVPVDTPFFNSTPRIPAPRGARFAAWQTLLNVNATQPDGGIARDAAAPVINIENQWFYSPYAIIGSGGKVSWDALAEAMGTADALTVDTVQTIDQQLISLEIHQLNAASFALPAVATPSVAAVTGGGSLAAGSLYVKCAALSGWNWFRGNGAGAFGSGPASAEASAAVAAGDSATASVAAVPGAAGYAWFVSQATGTEVFYTITYTNSVTITSAPGSAQAIPNLPGLFGRGTTGPTAVPTTDSSYSTNLQNGLVASILGDFASNPDNLANSFTSNLVTHGSGVSQGAYWQSLNGQPFTVSGAAVLQLDEMNRSIYDSYQVSPTRYLCSSKVINDISNATLDSPQAVTWLPTDAPGRARVTAGGHVANYINKTVDGKEIQLHLMPFLPPGQMVAVVDEIPFPGANLTAPLAVSTLYDFYRFDYGADRSNGGPRFDFEIRTEQAFVNKASPVMGVLQDIGDLS